MVWVSIILGILEALPGLINLFKQIWDAIHQNPLKVHAFNALLLAHRDMADPAKAEADFRAFHAVHVLGQAPAA